MSRGYLTFAAWQLRPAPFATGDSPRCLSIERWRAHSDRRMDASPGSESCTRRTSGHARSGAQRRLAPAACTENCGKRKIICENFAYDVCLTFQCARVCVCVHVYLPCWCKEHGPLIYPARSKGLSRPCERAVSRPLAPSLLAVK